MIQLTTSARAVQTAWRPLVDVYETPTRISVTIELAGIEAEEVLARALEPRPAARDKQEEVRQLVNL